MKSFITAVVVLITLCCYAESPMLGDIDRFQVYVVHNPNNPLPLNYDWALNKWGEDAQKFVTWGQFDWAVMFYDTNWNQIKRKGMKITFKIFNAEDYQGSPLNWGITNVRCIPFTGGKSTGDYGVGYSNTNGVAGVSLKGDNFAPYTTVDSYVSASVFTPLMPDQELVETRWRKYVWHDNGGLRGYLYDLQNPYPNYCSGGSGMIADIGSNVIKKGRIKMNCMPVSPQEQAYVNNGGSLCQWMDANEGSPMVATSMIRTNIDDINDIQEAAPYYCSVGTTQKLIGFNILCKDSNDITNRRFVPACLSLSSSSGKMVYRTSYIIPVSKDSVQSTVSDVNGVIYVSAYSKTTLDVEAITLRDFCNEWCTRGVKCDVDKDGIVNLKDYAIFANQQ